MELPKGAKILKVDFQGSDLCLWYQCVPRKNMEKVKRIIYVAATGSEVPAKASHISTVLEDDGKFVWHIFEIKTEVATA